MTTNDANGRTIRSGDRVLLPCTVRLVMPHGVLVEAALPSPLLGTGELLTFGGSQLILEAAQAPAESGGAR